MAAKVSFHLTLLRTLDYPIFVLTDITGIMHIFSSRAAADLSIVSLNMKKSSDSLHHCWKQIALQSKQKFWYD
jgi:hypothetical protein